MSVRRQTSDPVADFRANVDAAAAVARKLSTSAFNRPVHSRISSAADLDRTSLVLAESLKTSDAFESFIESVVRGEREHVRMVMVSPNNQGERMDLTRLFDAMYSGKLRNLTSLQINGFYFSPISHTQAMRLGWALEDRSTLTDLAMIKVGLNSAVLNEFIGNCQHLQTLNLSANPIDDSGARAIAAQLGKMRRLESLLLGSTNVTNDGFEELKTAAEATDNLLYLSLQRSAVTKDPKVWSRMSRTGA